MPDYIYLLENRLSADQRSALSKLREAAREAETVLFLTGDAVRDLTSGHAVRDLEISVHGNALKLKKPLQKLGAKVWGEDEATRTLYLCFPGTVRVDVVSTHRLEYPKPGKPVFHSSSIHEDLRRRDFTVNAMALSLNEGSFGLLMDPLNGAADIESRILRLVSNYGFIEDPSVMIRATRYKVRLGWELDPRSQARYENAKNEGLIEFLTEHARSRELEQIGHEEEGLKVLEALTAEGWMKELFPAWTPAKADAVKLKALHDLAVDLLGQGVHADISAAQMRLLTAGLQAKDLTSLKKTMLRPGFVEEWNDLDEMASEFSKVLLSKAYAKPSAAYKLFTSHDPEAILWLGFTSKTAAVKDRYNDFLKVWPEARQRIPYLLMQEMRITPELPIYDELLPEIFLQLIDGNLATPEEMRAFLEPHSPPPPPPPVTIKRTRAKRGAEAKIKVVDDDEDEDDILATDDDPDDMGGDDDDFKIAIPKGDLDAGSSEEAEDEDEDPDEDDDVVPAPRGKQVSGKKASTPVPVKAVAKPDAPKPETVKTPAAKPGVKSAPAKQPSKPVVAPVKADATKAKPVPVPVSKAAKPVVTKKILKPALAKKAAKPAARPVQAVVKSKTKPTKNPSAGKSSKKKDDGKGKKKQELKKGKKR